MHNRRDGLWLLKETNNPAISYFIRKPGPNCLKAFWVQPYTGNPRVIAALKSNGASILGDIQYGELSQTVCTFMPMQYHLHGEV